MRTDVRVMVRERTGRSGRRRHLPAVNDCRRWFTAERAVVTSTKGRYAASRARPEMSFRARAQAFGCAFGRNVALRHAQHFKTDHEFAHSCGAQQGRIEVR